MSGTNDPKNLDSKVVWDASSGGQGPVVKDGVFYPQRRSFLTMLGGVAVMLLGTLTGKSYAPRGCGGGAGGGFSIRSRRLCRLPRAHGLSRETRGRAFGSRPR